jgi:hypothetical protein
MVRTLPCLVVAACLSAAGTVQAASITFSAGSFSLTGIGNNHQGDSFEDDQLHVSDFTDTFTITTADGPVTRTINEFVFVVGDTGPNSDQDPPVSFAVPRDFTVNGHLGSISQDATVDVGFFGDSILFDAGTTVTFDLGADGFLDVTANALVLPEQEVGDHPGDLQATFLLRQASGPGPGADAPEPASLVLFGSGLLSAGIWRRRVRRQTIR